MRLRRHVLTPAASRRLAAVGVLVATAVSVPLAVATTPDRPATPVVAGRPAATGTAVLGPTDIAYLQLMVPMDVGALRLVSLAEDPAVAAVVAGHPAELARMRALLGAAGLPDGDLHDGHELPGLFSARQLDEVAALPLPERRARVVALLREHLAQGERISAGAARNARDPAVRALAVDVGAVRTGALARLKPGLGSG